MAEFMKKTRHQEVRLWLALLSCTNMIEGRLRKRLKRDFAFTLPRFDYLAQLEREPDGLTMGALSKRMMVTGGNVTGLTDQLEKIGLVVREASPTDRRVILIKITEQGLAKFHEMARTHEQWIRELIGELDETEIDATLALLQRLKAHVSELSD